MAYGGLNGYQLGATIYDSPNFVDGENPKMTENATSEEKELFEETFNDLYSITDMEQEYPNMEKPFRRWTGEVIDLAKEEK